MLKEDVFRAQMLSRAWAMLISLRVPENSITLNNGKK
jgi:hypothetical protein